MQTSRNGIIWICLAFISGCGASGTNESPSAKTDAIPAATSGANGESSKATKWEPEAGPENTAPPKEVAAETPPSVANEASESNNIPIREKITAVLINTPPHTIEAELTWTGGEAGMCLKAEDPSLPETSRALSRLFGEKGSESKKLTLTVREQFGHCEITVWGYYKAFPEDYPMIYTLKVKQDGNVVAEFTEKINVHLRHDTYEIF